MICVTRACAEELAQKPASWEQLMTAVAAGAIDYDAVADVTLACAAMAILAQPDGCWDAKVTEALFACDGDINSAPSQTLIACGKAADVWQRGAN